MVDYRFIGIVLVAVVIAAFGYKILKSIVKGTIIAIIALIILFITYRFWLA